jgi:predicted Zn-dependent protease
MRIRTYLGILLAVVVVVAASYLTHQNRELLYLPFRVTPERAVPLYFVLLAVFLAGFLPTVTLLLVHTLRRDLALRRERRLRREAKSLRAAFRRAVDFQADGQWGKAATELRDYLQGQPEDFAALLRYGEVLRHLGRVDEALEVHRRAAVLYPQSVALLYQLAEDYETRGEAEVAREVRSRVHRDFPGMGLQLLKRRRDAALAARNWADAGELQATIEALLREAGDETALQTEDGVARGLTYQRGVALLEGERIDEAAALFRGLLEREPRFIPAAIMLGEAHLERDDEPAALAEWRRGYETTGSPVFLQRIEDHFIERARPDLAIETLRGLIAGAQNDLLPRFFLGRLYYRLEMLDEAAKTLEGLAPRIQSSPTYHFLVGRIHERRGEMRRAVEAYLACIRELGIATAEYACRVCRARYPEWSDRCEACGAWNAIDLAFEEERLTPSEAGVRAGPVWGGYEQEPDVVEEGA